MLTNKINNPIINSSNNYNVLNAVFDFSDFSSEVQTHLAKVYRLLSVVILCSVFGSALQIKYFLLSTFLFPYIIALFLIIILIACIPRKKILIRVSLSMLFGILQGIIIGPLINEAINIDPNIVRYAFILTLCVFISFSLIAMITKNKKYFYLGSLLNSFCFFLIFMNIFPSSFGYNLSLYGGLLLFIGYVFYDTQQIIKRVQLFGIDNTDFISDAIQLYIDFVAIFVRILIIIMKSKQKNDGGHAMQSTSSVSTRNVKIDL